MQKPCKQDYLYYGNKEEFKVMRKFVDESFKIVNPLKLSKVIKEMIGSIESVKKLRDGRLILYT